MKVINLTLINSYTCQGCKKTFRSKQELDIERNLKPNCSKRCEFKVIYNWVRFIQYPNEYLEFIQKTLIKPLSKSKFNRNNAIYEITKYLSKKGLSSLNIVLDIRHGQTLDKQNVHESLDMDNPFFRKGVCLNLSKSKECLK